MSTNYLYDCMYDGLRCSTLVSCDACPRNPGYLESHKFVCQTCYRVFIYGIDNYCSPVCRCIATSRRNYDDMRRGIRRDGSSLFPAHTVHFSCKK